MSQAKLKPIYQLNGYLQENYEEISKRFLGQILTIVDASISDKEQRKGVKDLIKDKFYLGRPSGAMRYIIFDYCTKYCPETLPEDRKKYIEGATPNNPGTDELPTWNFEK